MAESLKIDDFKSQLKGGGVKPNLFLVTGEIPSGGNFEQISFRTQGCFLVPR